MAHIQRLKIFLLVTLLVASLESYARQRPGERIAASERLALGTIRGRVVIPNGAYTDEAIKITLSTLRGTLATTFAENQGQFEFQGVPAGTYYLEFEADRRRFHVVNETVQVYRSAPTIITVTLKPKGAAEGSNPDTISVAELRNKVPDKARKEFEKGSIAGSQGRTDDAIAHLRKAISIFPAFVRAHNDLGTYLLSQGKLDEAEEALRKAVALDASAFNPLLNLGIVLVHKQSFAEAVDQLTKALSLEPNSTAAHLYAGLAFVGVEKLDVAEKELKAAYKLGGQKYGVALYHLGQLYMALGDRVSALKSFEEYLSVVPDARNAQQVQKLIAALRP